MGEAHSPERATARRWAEAAVVAALAAGAGWVSLSGNLWSEFWWSDAARHAMDGVFVLDFVRDLPGSLSLYRYATEYYARYPCLGLVQYPPVFPVVESVFFAVLGVNMQAARAAVAAFAALGAVAGYVVARRFFGRWGGALLALLMATAPGVVYWSRGVMLETPVMAMMLVSSYCFLRYVDDGRRGFGVAAALALTAAMLTKQTACCLVPVWAVYAVWRRGLRILWRGETLLGAGLTALLLMPFVVATVMFSPVNIGQSVGKLSGGVVESRWSLQSAAFYLQVLPAQAGVMCLVGVGALVLGAALRWRSGAAAGEATPWHRGVVYGGLWAASCYAMLTFVVVHKEARFVLIWAPGLALLAAGGLVLLARAGRVARGVVAAATVVLACQAVACAVGWPHDPWVCASPYLAGTAVAARRVAASPAGTVVLYAGKFNGNFIFHMRGCDPERKVVVLRGSKVFYSVATIEAFGLEVHTATPEGIVQLLNDYGVRYFLVEEPTRVLDRMGPIMNHVRAVARSELFVRRGVYVIDANEARLARRLYLYERVDAQPARVEVLTLSMPASGRVLRVPFRRLGVPTAGTGGAR